MTEVVVLQFLGISTIPSKTLEEVSLLNYLEVALNAETGEILLQHDHPTFELAVTRLAAVGWRLQATDLKNVSFWQDVMQHTRTNEIYEEAPEEGLKGGVDDQALMT